MDVTFQESCTEEKNRAGPVTQKMQVIANAKRPITTIGYHKVSLSPQMIIQQVASRSKLLSEATDVELREFIMERATVPLNVTKLFLKKYKLDSFCTDFTGSIGNKTGLH
ncbi:hypothetical protein DdX_14410 [Ditylenchus destructor]|uniref:Uncharacterized protein n=1 Tax=Ditylenchus destructor TaxID=166010 RepID=A0AAD4MU82_9BILA|nr:hypothetical protein DdX_14410 [Ditylenchus destructor]